MYSSLQSTFLAMSLYPEVLKKAQAELDAVVGPDRLPDWDDQASLPYVTAVVKETLRWQNVLPLSVPHCTTADDEFRGYFIPAGTVLIANTWCVRSDAQGMEYKVTASQGLYARSCYIQRSRSISSRALHQQRKA